ncbi:phospholipase D family protein [Acinetobacter populi]|jgi:putative cardiolipin synthase|uniref:phospholipase D family protein n=1 Tax=Acinetobacter populi TaxID=1582270 RepID=UPI000B3EB494|nr:phospholipase D family protein [Acinetobacter populi]MCH4246352.1 phospholipase D family protein [Acinetobacter populi]
MLQACSTLPQRQPVTATYTAQFDTSHTYLSTLFEPLKQQHPDLTGFHVLYDPNEALTTRLQLIEKTEKTLDLQYYIWDNDKVGALALEAILRAADRGVKVRLLIDDNNSKGLEGAYLAMSQHPNIQIRVFNPYKFRRLRALDIMLDFNRITRRMHNKTFISDHEVALIGGRNMSNQYYNIGENFQFSDMDVVLVGQSVGEISDSFDEYWNHEYAYPITQVAKSYQHRLSYQSLRKQLEANWFKSNVQDDLNILSSSLSFDNWFNQNLNLEWVSAIVVKDSADKINKDTPQEQHLNFQLANILNHPEQHVDLVSAYFVPNKDNLDLLQQLSTQGVDIRVLTNSFKANDVPVVHAFYAKHRKRLLQDGIQLFEFLPVLPMALTRSDRSLLFGNHKFNRTGLSRSSLHAKFMTLDNQQVFIGSFNFDQRSVYLNTEIGVVLDSPNLAKAIHENMNDDLLKYAYQVQLDEKGKLIWKKQIDDQIKIYHKEPQLKWWQNIGLKLLSLLPIEKQM